ncbi:1769_t:CDS:10 [Paraglomus brasilianum]|uniref:1769_t:CDS:1 n=1 Tax=Paraglomus brasilianum TaxID=144538 RepID=A0A9N8WFX0_9GLOM|nr:1769_t:CDS:10 [Paraglomus brasilianum]
MSNKRIRNSIVDAEVTNSNSEQVVTRRKRARSAVEVEDNDDSGDFASTPESLDVEMVDVQPSQVGQSRPAPCDLSLVAEMERCRLRNRPTNGTTAEAGVIDSIELVNFMCHKYLKVNLGPKINFIIGHNGSGKSAILTAITVCLGGKATTTNRASSLKSLIREGASIGEVVVKLRNGGPDAYRPQTFGDTITIERRVTRDGTGSYKIKSADGRLISARREDLIAIMDHVAIQVDNPLNVLSQDTARQFLHTSSAEDKYKFFMKGTQLTQLSEDYELIRESIEAIHSIMKRKKELLPELHKEAKDAEMKYKEMQQARELEVTVARLKNEMAWAQVDEIEYQVEEAVRQVERAKLRLPAVEIELTKATADLQEVNEAINGLERQIHEQAEAAQPLQNKKKEIADAIKENRQRLQDIQREEKEINDFIVDKRSTVEQHRAKIEAETRRLELLNRARHEEIVSSLASAETEQASTEARLQAARSQSREASEALEIAHNQKRSVDENIGRVQREVSKEEQGLRQLYDQKRNRLNIYGTAIPAVIEAIKREHRWHKEPVGPLGVYVKLLKPEWGPTLDSVIGQSLGAFGVIDYHDQKLLASIMRKYNCQSSILVNGLDRFDYSHGEPAPKFLTILRVLQIDDEYVKRLLINSLRIESTILIVRRAEADDVMYNEGRGYPHNVARCYTMDGYRIGSKNGGFLSQAIPKHYGTSRFTNDIDVQILRTNQRLTENRNLLERSNKESERTNAEVNRLERKHDILKAECVTLNQRNVQLRAEIQQLRDKLQEDEPANISALMDAIKEIEAEIGLYTKQFIELRHQSDKINEDQRPLVTRAEEVHRQLLAMSEDATRFRDLVEAKVTDRLKLSSNISYFTNKLDAERRKVASSEEDLTRKKTTLEEATRQAEAYCPERVEVSKSASVLDREIKQIQSRLVERERQYGKSLEEIGADMKRKREAYTRARAEINNQEVFIKDLGIALENRMRKWHIFRQYIALRARINFCWQLSKRGFHGKLNFDHDHKKLSLKIQIDDQMGKSSNKDPRSLSGGEKSFSTICFLLSLWEGISCPIRCLDEFDVFMDAVNRRISMKMMIESAREADCTQYILITPQDASSIAPGPDVRIHRLHDPERGQATLRLTSG